MKSPLKWVAALFLSEFFISFFSWKSIVPCRLCVIHVREDNNCNVSVETVSPEDTFRDTVKVPSGAGDMQLI